MANNGVFTEEHRDAIRQISLGTKGTEDRAIGRFGKGLKSVFAWCEAFFIIARTDPKLGWTSGDYLRFLQSRGSGGDIDEWDEEFARAIVSSARQNIPSVRLSGRRLLAGALVPAGVTPKLETLLTHEEWISRSSPAIISGFIKQSARIFGRWPHRLSPSETYGKSASSTVVSILTIRLIFEFPDAEPKYTGPRYTSRLCQLVNGTIDLRAGDGRDAPVPILRPCRSPP